MAKEIRLTTFDNPFDPFDDFANWLLFDNQHGYFTVNKLDRLSNYTEDMTDEEMSIEHDRVVDEIITISDEEILLAKKELLESEGLLMGISSLAALAASKKIFKNEKGKNIVVVFPDGANKYFSTKFFE